MNRRTLLKSCGVASVALAGCLSTSGDDESSDDELEEWEGDGTDMPVVAVKYATIEIDSVNGLPETSPLSFDVEVVESTFVGSKSGDGHPARIRITLTNESDEIQRILGGHRKVFSATRGENGGYALVDPQEYDYTDGSSDNLVEPQCWKLTRPTVYPTVMREVTFDPEESKEVVLDLLTASDTKDCTPEGTFTFSDSYSNPRTQQMIPVGFDIRVMDIG